MRIFEIMSKPFMKSKQQSLKLKGQQLKREKAAFKLEKERSDIQQTEQQLADVDKPAKLPLSI